MEINQRLIDVVEGLLANKSEFNRPFLILFLQNWISPEKLGWASSAYNPGKNWTSLPAEKKAR
jgi:hypothetical protein